MQSKIWLGNRRTSTGFDSNVHQLYISHSQAWLEYLLYIFCLDGMYINAMYFSAMFCLDQISDLRFTFPRMHCLVKFLDKRYNSYHVQSYEVVSGCAVHENVLTCILMDMITSCHW